MRCPQCGKLDLHPVSLFEFTGGQNVRVACTCGSLKMIIGFKRPQTFWLQVPCFLCDGMHFIYYTKREFWHPEAKAITCPDTDLQLGSFGDEQQLHEFAADEARQAGLGDAAAVRDLFANPDVMYQMLSHVHDMAADGNLDCTCGNGRIEVDIFPDRVELICPVCRRGHTLPAISEEDLRLFEQ